MAIPIVVGKVPLIRPLLGHRGRRSKICVSCLSMFLKIEWMDPVTGIYVKKEALHHSGGNAKIVSPANNYDIALRIERSKK